MKKKILPAFISAIYISLAAFNLSCEVSEPERFYNANIDPIGTGVIISDTLQGQKVVSGKINVIVDTAGMNFPVSEMRLLVGNDDDLLSHVANNYPFSFEIDTWRYGNGIIDVKLWVMNKKRNNGLYNLGNTPRPALILEGKIDIDNSEPQAVTVTGEHLANSPYVTLSWLPTPARNFTSYIIYRSYYGEPLFSPPIDTLYNINDTVYVDTPELNHGAVFYSIMVTSNSDYSFSNTVQFFLP